MSSRQIVPLRSDPANCFSRALLRFPSPAGEVTIVCSLDRGHEGLHYWPASVVSDDSTNYQDTGIRWDVENG